MIPLNTRRALASSPRSSLLRWFKGPWLVRMLPLLAFLAAASLPVFSAPVHSEADAVFDQIQAIVETLSEISGLPEKRPVPYGRMSKDELRSFLTERVKSTIKPEQIHADEVTLKLFGLVPQDYDLEKSTIDLLTEQAAAFYDYKKKKLFLLSGIAIPSEEVTLAHELSHALADQHFGLERFTQEKAQSDDESLAHSAVVEGQASWLMVAYAAKKAGQAVPSREMLNAIAKSAETTDSEYPVLAASPLYIQQSLLFPYTHGVLFADAAFQKWGKKSFSLVFKEPPRDTSQIIHPERYFEHVSASRPRLPKIKKIGRRAELSEGTIGEFDHRVLITQYIDSKQAELLCPHLRGGTYRVSEIGPAKKPLLEYVSEWDTPGSALSFFSAYRKILHGKWKTCQILKEEPDRLIAGKGDSGYFVLSVQGANVTSIEGLQDTKSWETVVAMFSFATL